MGLIAFEQEIRLAMYSGLFVGNSSGNFHLTLGPDINYLWEV